MKKHVIVAAGLAVLSTTAFASKARLEALGQNSDTGSFFISDSRNVFKNPALVNSFNNYATFEWGETNNSLDTSSATSQATYNTAVSGYGTSQRPEGGFFRKSGSFSYGLFMNSNVRSMNSSIVSENSTFLTEDNRFDLFIAGEAGVKWGARLHYSSNKDERKAVTIGTTGLAAAYTDIKERTHSSMGLGLGVETGAIKAYANLDLKNEAENAIAADHTAIASGTAVEGAKFEGDLGLQVGGSYKMGAMTYFAEYKKLGYDFTESKADTDKTTVEDTTITIGAGNTHKISDSAKIFTEVAYVSKKEEEKEGTASGEEKSSSLPVTIGFEASANTWLTLRGSVTQRLVLNSEETTSTPTATSDGKYSKQNTTSVNAGATLEFGKLSVDGMIGSGTAGTLNTDNLLTKVGVTYEF